jgi:proteasome lid subunit RPN8/RPN11
MSLVLPAASAEDIRRHAEHAYPEETAGLMLGDLERGDLRRVRQVVPLTNRWSEAERQRRYLIDPRELMEAEDRADRDGLTILGIFHSHPDHPAQPSAFDLERALPFYTYLILRVDGGRAAESRAWRLADDRSRFDEESLDAPPSSRR